MNSKGKILLAVGGALFLFAIFNISTISSFFGEFFAKDNFQNLRNELSNIADQQPLISTPPPLRSSEKQTSSSILTVAGIIEETNKQRVAFGKDKLIENLSLKQAAQAKVEDMFKNQYFAHVAPDGKQAADFVEEYDYNYIAIGENLALGNYEDDKALVQAWMDSPGHRENILHDSFEEIGVAIKRGAFEGQTTWLAVQMFARPSSSCPAPDSGLRLQIVSSQAKLDSLQYQIETRKAELEKTDPQDDPQYNQKVKVYNELVKEYNSLAAQTKTQVQLYNDQVSIYNTCIKN